MPSSNPNFIVTIGRQMGSGGRELGRLLAQRLGIEFFDRRLLLQAVQDSGLIADVVERDDERGPGIFSGAIGFATGLLGSGMTMGSTVQGDAVYQAQSEVIRKLGETQSAVIVGRTADYVLREHPRCINIFIHASEDDCVRRIMSRGEGKSQTEARALCRKINKLRSNYYNFYTDRQWGHATTYDLTVSSSLMPMEHLADFVADYVRLRLGLKPL